MAGETNLYKLNAGVYESVPQLSHANQAAISVATAAALTLGTMTGTADGAMETVGATNSGDVSGAIMNNLRELYTQLNALVADVADIRTKYNQVRGDLVTTALIKGS